MQHFCKGLHPQIVYGFVLYTVVNGESPKILQGFSGDLLFKGMSNQRVSNQRSEWHVTCLLISIDS